MNSERKRIPCYCFVWHGYNSTARKRNMITLDPEENDNVWFRSLVKSKWISRNKMSLLLVCKGYVCEQNDAGIYTLPSYSFPLEINNMIQSMEIFRFFRKKQIKVSKKLKSLFFDKNLIQFLPQNPEYFLKTEFVSSETIIIQVFQW